MTNATGCSDAPTTDPCVCCDTLLCLPDLHAEAVERSGALVTVTVSTPWPLMECPTCGVVAAQPRSKKAYVDWLTARSPQFCAGVQVAALNPFAGYKTAIADELADATALPDAFHVVKLGTQAVDEVRRRVQQETLGHRGRKGDPLYGIQKILRAGAENLTDRQLQRLASAIES